MPSFLENLFGRVGGARQAAIIAVGVLAAALVFGVSQWANQPVMVPLITNVPASSVSGMTAKLTELGIAFTLADGGGTIVVDSASMARARVELAGAGLLETGRAGLELFDKPAWGMTDFTQKVNFRRAMEGELERNINKMTDVKSAQVHLALEDDQIFKQNERPSKASVTLTMANGDTPPVATVRGIARLVAGSVGGLTPDNVTIVDERGQALTLDDASSVTGLTSRQLEQQLEVEKQMKAKIEPLLTATYGAGNARVQVAAQLNFDRIERTTQSIDPDVQAVTSEATQAVTPSAPTQGAALNNATTVYDYTRANESFVAAVGGIRKLTVAVLIADKVTMPPPVTDTSAAAQAAPPAEPVISKRTTEELARVDSLVRNAVGMDSTRGDVLSVVSAPFYIPAPPARPDSVPTPTIVNRVLENPKPVVTIAAVVAVLIIALVMLGALRQKKAPALADGSQQALSPGNGYAELPASSQMTDAMQQALPNGNQNALNGGEYGDYGQQEQEERRAPVKLPPPPTTEEREQAIATVAQRPEAAIRVSKAWLRADR